MRIVWCVWFFLVVLGSLCLPCCAEGPTPQGFAITGLKDWCQSLKTGVYRARGRFEETSGTGATCAYEVEVFSAFNNLDGLLRVDWSRKQVGGPENSTGNKDFVSRTYKYCRTPESTLLWASTGRDLAVYRLVPEKEIVAFYKPTLDIRTMSLTNYHGLSGTLENILPRLETAKVVDETNGTARIRLRAPKSIFSSCISVSTKAGYAPIAMELRGDGEKEARCVSETTWTTLSQTWVPKSFHLKERLSPKHSVDLALGFDWEVVNGPVQSSLFSWEGFGLPVGTKVVDFRLGRDHPLTIAIIGEPHRGEPVPRGVSLGRDWLRLVIVILSLLGIGLCSAVLFWRLIFRKTRG